MYSWPKKLPCPFYNGYSYSPVNPFIRTQMDSGRARHRRRFKTVATKVSVTWKIPKADMADFRYFVFELVGADSGWGFFLTPLLFDDAVKPMKARFSNPETPFTATPEQNTLFVVTAELEVMELNLIKEDSFFERNPDVFDQAINPLHELINYEMPDYFGDK